MDREELAPHVEEVARVLGEKADKDEILKDLETYLNQYRVTLDWAKRNIVKKMGGDPNALSGGGGRKTVATLTGSEQSVDLLVKVLTVNPKTIEVGGVQQEHRLRPGGRRDRQGALYHLGDGGRADARKAPPSSSITLTPRSTRAPRSSTWATGRRWRCPKRSWTWPACPPGAAVPGRSRCPSWPRG